ncbi:MAG: AMP-binding protein [Clostridia bacterium]|nr:AMP-binding protein [Clostridia bacterium]
MRELIPWENDVLTVGGLLSYAAGRYADKDAIRYVGKTGIENVSYRRLFRDSRAVASWLENVSPAGGHVALIGRTDYRYIVTMNAVLMSGRVFVPMSPDNGAEKLELLLKNADVDTVFYDRTQEEKIFTLRERVPEIHAFVGMNDEETYDEIFASFDDAAPFIDPVDPDATAAIIYTSGTTGNFKGVMLSSRALISNVWFEEMDFEGEHVTLNVLPMHHVFCFSCDYLKNVKDGVTICLNVDLQNIYRNLLLFEPTVLRLVPMIIESLMKKVNILYRRHPEYTPRQAAEQVFGTRIRNIIASGAMLSPGLAHRFDAMGITIRQGYGMTETGPRISVPDGKTVCESGGRVISICQIRLQNGEIQVKSPSLMSGYYKNPEETAAVFTEDGWFKTGDIGELTADNELFIRGRIKNLIILSNGENVSPEEIEKKYADVRIVKEIVVYGEGDLIAAEIYPDHEYAATTGISDVEGAVREAVDRVNLESESTREIGKIVIRNTPFERTASGKIIRKQVKIA